MYFVVIERKKKKLKKKKNSIKSVNISGLGYQTKFRLNEINKITD